MTRARVLTAIGVVFLVTTGVFVGGLPQLAAAQSRPADVSGTVRLDGTPVTVTISNPGDNGLYTFSGSVGQRVAAGLSSSTFGPDCPAVQLSLMRPDGTQLGTPVGSCGASAFLEPLTLDQAGTWTVFVDPQQADVGSATLQAWSVPADEVKPITLNGAAIGVHLSTPGQNGSYTFSGTSGQKVSASVSVATFSGCPGYLVSLLRPDGSAFGSTLSGCGASAFLDGQTLDQTGTWTIGIDPQATATGTAKLNAYDATDKTKKVTPNGSPVSLSLPTPGQNGRWTFTGSVGQSVSAQLTAATFTDSCPTLFFSLVRPDGTTLGSPVSGCTDTATLTPQVLDQAGTWTFLVDPQGTATGSASVQAFLTNDDVRPITLNGAAISMALNAGQNGEYTFSGTSGQQVSAAVNNSTFPGCPGYVLSLQRPDGSQFGTVVNGCSASAFLDSQTLDQSGTWAFVVHTPGGAGTASLSGYTFADLTAPADLTGKALKLVFTQPGQNARLSFAGTVGQEISAYLTASSITGTACPDVALSLVRPDGSTLPNPVSSCSDSLFLDTLKLDQAGTWTVFIDPQAADTGTLTAQVFNVVDDVRTISSGGVLKSFTAQQPGVNGRYRFAGSVGQTRRVTISYSTFGGCPAIVVSFIRPDGSTLTSNSTCNANLVLGPAVLDATGTWTVFVDPQGPVTGTLVIKMTSS